MYRLDYSYIPKATFAAHISALRGMAGSGFETEYKVRALAVIICKIIIHLGAQCSEFS